MTENEVKETREWFEDFIETYALSNQETIEFKKAVACLEELQQYRAIVTPTQIYEKIGGLDVELGKYRSIGTIEELKALKEKNVAKKPIDKIMYLECPTCGDVGILDCGYCSACGQKLDWE